MPDSNCHDSFNVLFFGLGSIGSRLAGLIKQHFPHYKILAFRNTSRPLSIEIDETNRLVDIEKFSPDIAFITNPTALHADTAIYAASLGAHLFIEKPLCNTLARYDQLLKIIQRNRLITYVGCNLRFDPILEYLKPLIGNRKIYYANVTSSSYLPDWRPNQDYRHSYSAKKELGGGVLLDLIHEPDYCSWFFGPVDKIEGTSGKCSHLDIETEDVADITLYHSSGVISQIHLDYFGLNRRREIHIFGDNFQIIADFVNRSVRIFSDEVEEIKQFPALKRDDTYKKELDYFFKSVKNNVIPMNHIEEHYAILNPIIEFKKTRG